MKQQALATMKRIGVILIPIKKLKNSQLLIDSWSPFAGRLPPMRVW